MSIVGEQVYPAKHHLTKIRQKNTLIGNKFSEKKKKKKNQTDSQFSHSVVSDSLQPHRLQHTGFPCPSPTPGVYSNLRP